MNLRFRPAGGTVRGKLGKNNIAKDFIEFNAGELGPIEIKPGEEIPPEILAQLKEEGFI